MSAGVGCFKLLYKPEVDFKIMIKDGPLLSKEGPGWLGRHFFLQKSMRNELSLFEPSLNHFVGIASLGAPSLKGGDFKAA